MGRCCSTKASIYAPDYVINAGGIINIASELEGYNEERALNNAGNIYNTITDILNYSEEHGIPAHKASNALAEKRIETVGKIKNKYSSNADISGRVGSMYKRFID